jgi:hypothetical protein
MALSSKYLTEKNKSSLAPNKVSAYAQEMRSSLNNNQEPKNLVGRQSRFSLTNEIINYDQTLFPRIDKKIISVYKIADQQPLLVDTEIYKYIFDGYWDDYYTGPK